MSQSNVSTAPLDRIVGSHEEPMLKCKVRECGHAFGSLPSLLEHSKLHAQKFCPECSFSARPLSTLRRHMRIEHDLPAFVCNFTTKDDPLSKCGMGFDTQPKLTEHMLRHRRKLELTCTLCHQHFYKIDTFTRHQQVVHLGKRPYICTSPECLKVDRAFPSPWGLQQHRTNAHSGPPPQPCEAQGQDTATSGADDRSALCPSPRMPVLLSPSSGALVDQDERGSTSSGTQGDEGPKRVRRKLTYKCHCGEVLQGWVRLRAHENKVHGTGAYICDWPTRHHGMTDRCGKVCRDKWAWRRHVKGHEKALGRRDFREQVRAQRRLQGIQDVAPPRSPPFHAPAESAVESTSIDLDEWLVESVLQTNDWDEFALAGPEPHRDMTDSGSGHARDFNEWSMIDNAEGGTHEYRL